MPPLVASEAAALAEAVLVSLPRCALGLVAACELVETAGFVLITRDEDSTWSCTLLEE